MSTTKQAARTAQTSGLPSATPEVPAAGRMNGKDRKTPARRNAPGNGAMLPVRNAMAMDGTAEDRSRWILGAMVAFRDGDFGVRLPTHWSGMDGQIAEAFNQAVAQEDRIAQEVRRLSTTVGKEGRLTQRMSVPGRDRRAGRQGRVPECTAGRSRAPDPRRRAHDRRRRQRRSRSIHGARSGRPRAERRIPALREAREHDDRAAVGVHLGSHARRARGRHGRQARRPGASERRVRRVEGTHRVGQPDGRQSDGPGSQHRRRHHRGRQRRPVEEDHGRRARRDSAAEGSHQHDGRPAPLVRVRGDARRARGRHRRASRRSGRGAGRRQAPGRTSPTRSTPWRRT